MRSIEGVGLSDVTAVYGGAQADLYALLFGELLHIGGMAASADLAERADIGPGSIGVDLCCGNGAGMRYLVRMREVASMVGVDVTPRNIEKGQQRCRDEGLEARVKFVLADATNSGLPAASADFVWGEDAWCYVPDKAKLVAEATRLLRPGGTIAFTDWVEGPARLDDDEAERFLRMMNFANVEDISGYARLLSEHGCRVIVAEDTGRMPGLFYLFVNMIEKQLSYDVLATVGYQQELLSLVTGGFQFLGDLARAGKIVQARFTAQFAT